MPRIVIADDSPTLRRIVSSVLTSAGHEVVQAEDGVDAVQTVFREQPDAVVMDVQMPRVSGYVATRLLKDDWQTADIPVVLLTSLDAASDRYWGTKTGADGYLTKDFEAPDLTGAVDEVLAKAAAARGGRPSIKPDPVELSADDVLSKVCDLLDRKLFETSVAASVTELATTPGFEASIWVAREGPPSTAPPKGWTRVSSPATTIGTREVIDLDTASNRYRRYLVWITKLPPDEQVVRISELLLYR